MKWIFLIALTLCSTYASAAEWWWVTIDAQGGYYFIDASSIVRAPKSTKAWISISNADSTSSRQLWEYSCSTREFRNLLAVNYTATGTPTTQQFTNPRFSPIVPDSVGDTISAIACAENIKSALVAHGTKVSGSPDEFSSGARHYIKAAEADKNSPSLDGKSENWWWVSSDDDGDQFFVELSTISSEFDKKTIWSLVENANDTENKTLISINCTLSTMQQLKTISYNEKSAISGFADTPGQLQKIDPKTIASTLQTIACSSSPSAAAQQIGFKIEGALKETAERLRNRKTIPDQPSEPNTGIAHDGKSATL